LPQALAILNPKLLPESSPFFHLCGAGTAYKLCEGLVTALNHSPTLLEDLIDLAAIGTVVDMVPLLGENRALVYRGVQALAARKRLGLATLLESANVPPTAPINTETIGFVLGPRLNAIGRIAHAGEAVDLLLTDDPEEARRLAARLEQVNRQRKELVESCLLQAQTHLNASGELDGEKAIIMAKADWHAGVVGLVATRLVDGYQRPAFIGYVDEESDEFRFSARSIAAFDLHHHLEKLASFFVRWGGHCGAAGFSIKRSDYPAFKQQLLALCREKITDEMMAPILEVDLAVTPTQLNSGLYTLLQRLAPFGQGNREPVLALESAKIGAQNLMGQQKNHLKLVIPTGGEQRHVEAVQWNWGSQTPPLDLNEPHHLAFRLSLNTYQGQEKLQLMLADVRTTSSPAAPVPAPTVPAALPQTETPTLLPASPSDVNSRQWVDHRRRTRMDDFLWQILEQLAHSPRQVVYRVYSEGTQSALPYPVSEQLMVNRLNASHTPAPVDQLILWDLPPDLASLNRLIEATQPQTIHLMGGKYQKMPVLRPTINYLEGLYQTVQRHVQSNAAGLSLFQLSVRLSVPADVILAGLSVMENSGLLASCTVHDGETLHVAFHANLPSTPFAQATQSVAFHTFEHAVQRTQQFRQWLLRAPLAQICASVDETAALGREAPPLVSSAATPAETERSSDARIALPH
jgi:single-stranded-DNA-specific exonuclease RecJ